MPDGKWVSKENLQTFWQMIRSKLASFVTEDVNNVLPTIVPEELNKVLPAMVGEQIDDKFGDDIGDNVTAWLTEHVNPAGSAVVVDDTLTIQGAAADAKKTGDEISGLKEDMSQSVNDLKSAFGYETGLTSYSFTLGKYIKTVSSGSDVSYSLLNNNDSCCAVISCSEGEKYYITGTPFNTPGMRPYMLVDSSNKCVYRSNVSTAFTDLEVIIPESATTLVINLNKNNAHQVLKNGKSDLNKRLSLANDAINSLELNKADAYLVKNFMPNISMESFEYQQNTIHHDNFHRTVESPLWHIGNNGTEEYPMSYSSPFSNYDTVDDGFRIINNKLTITAVQGVTGRSARILDNIPSAPFLVEIGFDVNQDGFYTGFAYNFTDVNNFDSFYFYTLNDALVIMKYGLINSVAKEDNGRINKTALKYTAKSIRVIFYDSFAAIYWDDTYICTVPISLQQNSKIALPIVSRNFNYQWDFVNVHNISKPNTYNAGLANDYFAPIADGAKNEKTNVAVTQSFDDENFAYLYNRDSETVLFSPYSEKFVLKRIADNLLGSRRTEVTFNQIDSFFKLNKVKLEFDLFLPSSYTTDTLQDCLCQFPTSPNDTSSLHPDSGYNPCVALRTRNNKIYLTTWGQSEQNNTSHEYEAEAEICDVETGKWMHFEIFIKKGYMEGHCPLTILKKDGKTVYKSTMPNSVNSVYSGKIKYGIYKAEWYHGETGLVEERTVYFDNVKLTI